jgi:hypothetical protein
MHALRSSCIRSRRVVDLADYTARLPAAHHLSRVMRHFLAETTSTGNDAAK